VPHGILNVGTGFRQLWIADVVATLCAAGVLALCIRHAAHGICHVDTGLSEARLVSVFAQFYALRRLTVDVRLGTPGFIDLCFRHRPVGFHLVFATHRTFGQHSVCFWDRSAWVIFVAVGLDQCWFNPVSANISSGGVCYVCLRHLSARSICVDTRLYALRVVSILACICPLRVCSFSLRCHATWLFDLHTGLLHARLLYFSTQFDAIGRRPIPVRHDPTGVFAIGHGLHASGLDSFSPNLLPLWVFLVCLWVFVPVFLHVSSRLCALWVISVVAVFCPAGFGTLRLRDGTVRLFNVGFRLRACRVVSLLAILHPNGQLAVSLRHGSTRKLDVGPGLHPRGILFVPSKLFSIGFKPFSLWSVPSWIEHFGAGFHPHRFFGFAEKCFPDWLISVRLRSYDLGFHAVGFRLFAHGVLLVTARLYATRLQPLGLRNDAFGFLSVSH